MSLEHQMIMSVGVEPGEPRLPCPGGRCRCPEESCKGNQGPVEGKVNLCSGNFSVKGRDPVKTRSWPLTNNIHLDTHHAERNRAMGNAIFTYDIHLVKEPVVTFYNNVSLRREVTDHYVIVDGTGARLDFGKVTENPKRGYAIFSDLFPDTNGGYRLTNAGAPEHLHERGNFTYFFNADGQLTKLIDPNNNQQTFTYSSTTKRLTRVDDTASKKYLAFQYDSTGLYITKVIENGGPYTNLTYDDRGSLTSWRVFNEDGTTVYSYKIDYYNDNLPSKLTLDDDPLKTLNIEYTFGLSIEGYYTVPLANIKESAPGANDGSKIEYAKPIYKGEHLTKQTASNGGVTEVTSDLRGEATHITAPKQQPNDPPRTTQINYSATGLITDVISGDRGVSYTYDVDGRVTKVTDKGDVYNFSYSGNNVATVTNGAGQLIGSWFYNNNSSLPNSPTQFKDALNNIWNYSYNAYGQLTKITPPVGSAKKEITFAYNETSSSPYFGWLTSVTNGAGQVLRVDTYNKLGEPTKWTRSPSATPLVIEKSSDALNRPTQRKNADASTVKWEYQGGLLKSITDELNRKTSVTICPRCGGLNELTGPLNWNLKWTRDGDFDVTSFKDALNNTTQYAYNRQKDLSSITYPDGTGEQYLYERYGKLESLINGRGERTDNYYWYEEPRLVQFPGDPQITRTFASNNTSNTPSYTLQSTSQGNLKTSYTYTKTGMVSTITYEHVGGAFAGKPQTVQYSYYADDVVKTVTWRNGTGAGPIAGSWDYTYNGVEAVTKVVNNFGETTNYTYDSHGRIITQDNVTSKTRFKYTYASTRDWLTRILIENYATNPVTTLYDFKLSYNLSGNITGIQELSSNRTFSYDALDRLTQETITGTGAKTTTWGYDLSGNITKKNNATFGTYDVANKLVSIANQVSAPQSDGDGNTTSLAITGKPGLSLKWNTLDKLKELITTNPARTVQNTYNPDSGLLSIRSTINGENIFYVRDIKGKILGEYTNTGTTFSVKKVYTYGADGLVSQRDIPTAKSYWYLYGAQGETRALVNSTATITNRYEYDPYGISTTKVEGISNDFEYTGKHGCQTDDVSQLVLCRQRWYAPVLGRWISRDPIKYDGGINLYEYVGGNPVTLTDYMGLKPGDTYSTVEEAGIEAVKEINETSIKENIEYAGELYKKPKGGYSYTEPEPGSKAGSKFNPGDCPKGTSFEGSYHTHGGPDPEFGIGSEQFSPADKNNSNKYGKPSFLGSPSGHIQKYEPSTGTISSLYP